jgi:hypothetical protein
MQTYPDQLYEDVLHRQREIAAEAARHRHSHLFPSRPWLDLAMWSAIIGPIVGMGFLVYFGRVVWSAVGG